MYCTKADLLNRFREYELIRLTDDDDDVLNQAINDATAEIDSYLIGRYVIPLENPTADIIHKACDLTLFYLHSNRGEIDRESQIQRRYDAVIRFLEQVAKGMIQLNVTIPDTIKQGSGVLIESNTQTSWDF